ncbi:hypothetical protein [Bacillus sp. OV166]|uniref:hypothetical protein n=1 Tax=Bacillus sp. OV166 TaxID=1882763 RepID=UPI000B445605|nr:hypothetical protein [Bacillus sp. OV166]
MYKYLEEDWHEILLEIMINFFQKDTFLIRKPSFSILREPKERICELCRRNENELLDKTNIIQLEEKVLVELTGALLQ